MTITGSGFVAGSTVSVDGGPGITPTAITPTTVEFSTPAHLAGTVGVTVTTPGGTTTPGLDYAYLSVPTASGLNPTSGPVAGGQLITITGTGFVPGSSVSIDGGPAITPTTITPTAARFATPAHLLGLVEVALTTPGGTTSTELDYTYLAVPTATSLDPASGPVAGGQSVTVTGSGFVPGVTVSIDGGPAITPDATTPTTVEFTTPAHVATIVGITVTSPGGGSAPALDYTFLAVPTASAIDPDTGPDSGGQDVLLTGSGFVDGATTVTIGGITLPVEEITVDDPAHLEFATPAHVAAGVTVTVDTAGGPSAPGLDYTYVAAPVLVSEIEFIDPDTGPTTGGQTVTVDGSGFVPGTTEIIVDATVVPAAEVTVTSSEELTFVTPVHDEGPVEIASSNQTPLPDSDTADYLYVPPGDLAPPAITEPVDGSSTSDPRPSIAGSGGEDDLVAVTEGETLVCLAVVESDLTWTCSPGHPFALGRHTISATQSLDGETFQESDPTSFTIVAAPTVVTTLPPLGNTDGGGNPTTDTSPTLARTGDPIRGVFLLGISALLLGTALAVIGRRSRRRGVRGGL